MSFYLFLPLMGIFEVVLTSILVVISLLLILVILIQSNRSAGMGLFGGGASQTAFGSSSGDILTKITGIMATAFLLITLGLAYIKSQSGDSGEERLLNKDKNTLKTSEKTDDKAKEGQTKQDGKEATGEPSENEKKKTK